MSASNFYDFLFCSDSRKSERTFMRRRCCSSLLKLALLGIYAGGLFSVYTRSSAAAQEHGEHIARDKWRLCFLSVSRCCVYSQQQQQQQQPSQVSRGGSCARGARSSSAYSLLFPPNAQDTSLEQRQRTLSSLASSTLLLHFIFRRLIKQTNNKHTAHWGHTRSFRI